MGDAAGIGPELIISALQNEDVAASASHFVIGSMEVMQRAARAMKNKAAFAGNENGPPDGLGKRAG